MSTSSAAEPGNRLARSQRLTSMAWPAPMPALRVASTFDLSGPPRSRTRDAAVVAVVVAVLAGAALWRDNARVETWTTLFMAVFLQALPFLALGVVVSGAIATWMSASAVRRLVPRQPVLAVPLAAAAGVVLPGCECGSVPVSGRLVDRGAPLPVALAFLLAAPAINPVVLVSTAVAFPGQPMVVVARGLASFTAAVFMGWAFQAWQGERFLPARLRTGRSIDSAEGEDDRSFAAFCAHARHDLVNAGGFLVIGAALAATLQVVVPRSWLSAAGGNLAIAVATLAVLAVAVAICSEADAFIAASMVGFPLTARLVFMVVGPAVDVKLVAMQRGTFGGRFTARFAPLTFVVAVLVAFAFGQVLL